MNVAFLSQQATKKLVIASLIVIVGFLFEGYIGVNLADEGFLWYGAQRVLLGEAPMRDFMAYDPFRYYWIATCMNVIGTDSIVVQRVALAVLQGMGIWALLDLIGRNKTQTTLAWLVLVACLAWIWFIPRHKVIDITAACLSLYVLANLFDVRTERAYLITGIWLGFLVFVGRNHCLYASIGWVVIQGGMGRGGFAVTSFLRAALVFGFGMLVGLLPMLLMILYYPGFWDSYIDSINFILQVKATNLSLPIMWPWNFNLEWLASASIMHQAAGHGILTLLLMTGGVMLVRLLLNPWTTNSLTAPVAACASLILPYGHFAFSRADLGHLAQGIFPFLSLMILLLVNSRYRTPAAVAMLALSVWITLKMHPGGARLMSEPLATSNVAGTSLLLSSEEHQILTNIQDIHTQFHTPNGTLYTGPTWPGVYPLLRVKAPVWELYPLWKRGEEFESAEIARLDAGHVDYLLLDMAPIDGNPALLLENSHPLMWKWFMSHFQEQKALQLGSVHVWARRELDR